MAEKIKKDNFIEIEYTGRTLDDNEVFDTTNETLAKELDMYNPNVKYGYMIICVGEGQVLKGLDEKLIGLEIGKTHIVTLDAEHAFGKRMSKYIHLINTNKFKKQNINPVPGMQVTVDNMAGIVKTVTGNRTMVDFNHPLASKDVVYEVKVNNIITDDNIKAEHFLGLMFGFKNVNVELKENVLTVKMKNKMPDEVFKKLEEKIKKVIPSIKKIDFVTNNT